MMLFETLSLSKVYRAGSRGEVRALDAVSLSIARGSLVAISGPSGSGKSTLLGLLGALEWPTHGQVLFEDQNLGACSGMELARVRRRLGFIFQDFALIPNLTAEENIVYPLIPRGIPRSERRRRVAEVLERFGMEGRRSTRARSLSGGEQQRVAIARALAGGPEILLADEPTSNLDSTWVQTFLSILAELHRAGKTIIVSTHDPQVMALATETKKLQGGRLKSSPADGSR